MSGGLEVLSLKEDDVTKMLAANTHLGASNMNFQMDQYVYKCRPDGVHIINIHRTWEKLLLAARAIAATENFADVFVISSRPYGQRAVLKFAAHTGATPIAGRFTPGAFTNQIQAAFREPRLLIVTDPAIDHQPITEASYVNIPVIAFCNTDSPLRYVDIAIPGNNKSAHSIGLLWWFLAREVLRFRGNIPREGKWEVMADLFFYREPEEAEKDEQAAKESALVKQDLVTHEVPDLDWTEAQDWGADNIVSTAQIGGVPSTNTPSGTVPTAGGGTTAVSGNTFQSSGVTDNWTSQPQEEWTNANTVSSTVGQPNWGGATSDWH